MSTFFRRSNNQENRENVAFGRRQFLGIGAAAGGLGLATVFFGRSALGWLTRRPLEERFAPKSEDGKYRKVIEIFSHGPLTYDEAVLSINEHMGISVRKHRFNLVDKLGLTSTRRFYNFQPTLLFLPEEVKPEERVVRRVSALGSVHYDTWRSVPEDGRIQAVADYILTRCELESGESVYSAGSAVALIAGWVMRNVKTDLKHSTSIPISTIGGHTNEYGGSAGLGRTNSFSSGMPVLQNGGVCTDYSNILSDLLNSIGIPARTLGITAIGIYKERRVKVGMLSHSIVEVFAGSRAEFLDVTPKQLEANFGLYNVTVIERPEEYIAQKLASGYSRIELAYTYITGAMPEERMTDDLRRILDTRPFDFMSDARDFIKKYKGFIAIHGKEYVIYYYNRYQ